jgi:hypothetical protein
MHGEELSLLGNASTGWLVRDVLGVRVIAGCPSVVR